MTNVRRDFDGVWFYESSDPFVDGQRVGSLRPSWVDAIIRRADEIKYMDRQSLEMLVIRLEQEINRLRITP